MTSQMWTVDEVHNLVDLTLQNYQRLVTGSPEEVQEAVKNTFSTLSRSTNSIERKLSQLSKYKDYEYYGETFSDVARAIRNLRFSALKDRKTQVSGPREKEWITSTEVLSFFGISNKRLYQLTGSGKVRTRRSQKRRNSKLYNKADLSKYTSNRSPRGFRASFSETQLNEMFSVLTEWAAGISSVGETNKKVRAVMRQLPVLPASTVTVN